MTELATLQIQWINSKIASRLNPENNPIVPPILPNLSVNDTLRDLFSAIKVEPLIATVILILSSFWIFLHKSEWYRSVTVRFRLFQFFQTTWSSKGTRKKASSDGLASKTSFFSFSFQSTYKSVFFCSKFSINQDLINGCIILLVINA